MILAKRFDWKDALIQMVIAFLFGFFIDLSLRLIDMWIPVPTSLIMQGLYLSISLFLVAGGLFLYSSTKLTLMPYDELTKVISRELHMPFGKAKITGDVINVIVAGLICLIFLRSFGSIGIGTVFASVFIGKILGWFMKHLHPKLVRWLSTPTAEKDVAH